jgi:hypothetical protein
MKNLISTIAILLLSSACFSWPAHALSPLVGQRVSTVSFAKDNFMLSTDATTELQRHVSCVNTIALQIIVVQAFGDSDSEGSDRIEQLKLAAHRAIEIRRFFLAAGIPERAIYSEPRLLSNPLTDYRFVSRGQRFEQTAVVETVGHCRSTTEGNDCRVLCNKE